LYAFAIGILLAEDFSRRRATRNTGALETKAAAGSPQLFFIGPRPATGEIGVTQAGREFYPKGFEIPETTTGNHETTKGTKRPSTDPQDSRLRRSGNPHSALESAKFPGKKTTADYTDSMDFTDSEG
jgi:hypothetical protein